MIARAVIVILLLCVVGLLAGLSLSSEEPADFTFVSGAEPETLDPALMTGVLESRFASALFEGLTTANPRDLSVEPGMAERWTVSDDGLVYTFFLREANWSNGDPVTAHDFVYSWRRVLEPETAASYAYQLYYIKNARAYNSGFNRLQRVEIVDWPGLRAKLARAGRQGAVCPGGRRILGLCPADVREALVGPSDPALDEPPLAALNDLLARRDFYEPQLFRGVALPEEAKALLRRPRDALSFHQVQRLNRLVLEAAYPAEIATRPVEDYTFDSVGVRAEGPRKLVVTLERPTPFFLSLTWFMTLLPVNSRCVEQHGDTWTRPGTIVTNGPFLLQDWRINRRLRLRKNPSYWDAAKVRLDTVDALTVESSDTGFNIYETAGADLLTAVPLSLADVLPARSDYHSSTYLNTYFYRFNVTQPPLDDARVRRALTMTIDRERVTRYITRGGETPAETFVPLGMPGYTPGRGLPFDPERARGLLADAGYPDGQGFPEIELLFNTSEAHKDIAEVVQDMWRRHLGIRVRLVNQEWKVYLANTRGLQYQVARSTWIGDYCDPNTFLDMFVTGGGNNRTGWSDPRYDALIADAAHEPAPARRMELLRRAETILCAEAAPIAPIYFAVSNNLYRPYVHGIYPNVLNQIMLKRVWVER